MGAHRKSNRRRDDLSAKPDGVGAVCQPWIAKAAQSGLLTRTAAGAASSGIFYAHGFMAVLGEICK